MDWLPLVETLAVALAGWAAWLSIPREPDLDWERLFKATVSVGIWAREERSSGDDMAAVEERWRVRLQESVPYHPAGRRWRDKLRAPGAIELPVPALPGERALVEALASLDSPVSRWDRLFGAASHAADGAGLVALGDPRELGDAYDPRRLLGPDADWEAVASWSPAVVAGIARRLGHVVVLNIGVVEGCSPSAVVPDLRHHAAAEVSAAPEGGWLSVCEAPSDRLIVVLGGDQLLPWLRRMADQPALVDRVILILVVGGAAASVDNERQDLISLLTSADLLPELQRRTPVAAIDDISPEAPLSTGMAPIDLDDADPDRLGVDWVDLGPLPVDRVPTEVLARALTLSAVFLLSG